MQQKEGRLAQHFKARLQRSLLLESRWAQSQGWKNVFALKKFRSEGRKRQKQNIEYKKSRKFQN